MAGTSWNSTTCGPHNFGYRTTCFACERDRGNAKLNKTGGPSSKPGRPASNPSGPAPKAGEPRTKSGANSQSNHWQGSLLTGQTLRKQIRAAKDDLRFCQWC
eukprot:6461432-Amphidinium_carterae.1